MQNCLITAGIKKQARPTLKLYKTAECSLNLNCPVKFWHCDIISLFQTSMHLPVCTIEYWCHHVHCWYVVFGHSFTFSIYFFSFLMLLLPFWWWTKITIMRIVVVSWPKCTIYGKIKCCMVYIIAKRNVEDKDTTKVYLLVCKAIRKKIN